MVPGILAAAHITNDFTFKKIDAAKSAKTTVILAIYCPLQVKNIVESIRLRVGEEPVP